ncbi:MAG TPA: AAA family ATPase [Thermoanaerobaculia bacterium]|nr:AAA family ATPase [Thermoanaerobaculia bacterium]
MGLSFDQIVLAGPIAAGKSTLSLAVAERLGLPCYVADSIKTWFYYERGYDAVAARRAQRQGGTEGRASANKPYDLYAVERMLAELHDCVIDLGAGHACYLDPGLLERAQALFAPLRNSFLILPSRDPERTLAILDERIRKRADPEDAEERTAALLRLNRAYLAHPSYRQLLRKPIYVEERRPEEVAEEIVARISRPSEPSRDLDLLILIGPNGVGKSTVGRCLASRLGYRFLPVEEFWKARYATIEEIYAKLPEAYQAFEDHVRAELAASDVPVVFESGGRHPHDIELIRSLSEAYRSLLVRVHADLDTCQRRVRERGTGRNFPKTPEYVLQCHRDFFGSYVERYDFALVVENRDLSEDEISRTFQDFERDWRAAPEEARWGCRIRA